jgi:hypothetical protein
MDKEKHDCIAVQHAIQALLKYYLSSFTHLQVLWPPFTTEPGDLVIDAHQARL